MNFKPFFNPGILSKWFCLTLYHVMKYDLTPIEAHFHVAEKLLEARAFGNCGGFFCN